MRTLLPAVLLLLAASGNSQTLATLDANKVNAVILNRNDMFWHPLTGYPGYEVPKGSGKHANFLGSLWIGGLDAGGQLHLGAMTYRQAGMDFWPGPLDTINATCDSATSANFDRLWKVSKKEIDDFVTAWNNGSLANNTYTPPAVIMDWPGNGNPQQGYASQLAPYVDNDSDGIYDPIGDGDYPLIKGDQMVYYVCNDNMGIHGETQAPALGIEMHVSAYSYSCTEALQIAPELDYATFYHYRIINRSNQYYMNTIAAVFSDVDAGFYNNDYVGCDTVARIGYVYNWNGFDPVYQYTPPVTSYQILKGPLADGGDFVDNDKDGFTDEPGEEATFNTFMNYHNNLSIFNGNVTNPAIAAHYYEYMNARWKNGALVRADSMGYLQTTTVQAVKHIFPGDPFGNTGWTEYTRKNKYGDRRMVIGNGPFTFAPGESIELEYCILTTFTTGTNGFKDIPQVKKQQAALKSFYLLTNKPECIASETVTAIDKHAAAEITLVPNPSRDQVEIRTGSNTAPAHISVLNILGGRVGEFNSENGSLIIGVRDWPAGLYLVRVEQEGRISVKRLLKE